MAPFLTHLVVGERVWAALVGQVSSSPVGQVSNLPPGQVTNLSNYGTFLFGCLAPDVDKFCDGLEQGTTHFLPKDRQRAPLRRHTHHFLDHQTDFLRAPFADLAPEEQAFVRGYLCHIATDEVTGRLGRTLQQRLAARGTPLPNVDALLTAIDPRLWAKASDPEAVLSALAAASIPADTWTFAPHGCLAAMHRIVLPQVQEGGGLEPYLRMVRRHWYWLRHGRVSDAQDDPDLEADLTAHRRHVEADLPRAEQLLAEIDLGDLVEQAVQHSLQVIEALDGGYHSRVPGTLRNKYRESNRL